MSILYIRDKNGNFIQMPSVPGKSAYEIAVAKGTFSGTEQEFAEMQVINNKDIIDQITQENIDNWNNTIDRIELTDREQLVFYSGDTIISRIQLQKGMTDEEKEKLDTKLSMKFDDVKTNEEETTDMQTAIDFFSNGVLVKTLYFANGTGGNITSAYISTELEENVMVGTDENFNLTIDFASPNPGKGTLKVFINDVEAVSKSIGQGESTTIIEGAKFSKGNNRVVVYVLDRVGVMSNSLTFYVRYGGTEIISDFDQYSAYDYGATIRYYFTPTAIDTSLTLTFYMSIDGTVQQGISCTSDTRGYYTFPTNLSADSHYCEAYIIDSSGTKSNVLTFNLVILDTNSIVIASDTKSATVEEGEQLSLDYKVYMKNNTSFITKAYVDNNLVNTGTCNADFNYYKTSSLTEGMHTVKLEVWDVTETYSDYITWTITVTPSTYEMKQPINAGAMFIGTAINKSNSDERKQYFIGHDQEGNEVLGTLTNFAFNSESGWVNDELIISGNSHVEIPVQPLVNNAKYGFTLDIEFTSKQIGVTDAEVLTLWNDETNCGIKITTEKLILQSSNGNKCDLYFTDNERTHVMFVIDRQELKAKIYLNGVMCEAFHLNDYTVDGVAYLEDFTVNSNIVLGGLNKNGYCKIRNLRVYQVALTTDEIINNFISCEIDKGKQRELVEFQKGNDLPTLYVYCDFSGLGKDDKKPCKIVYQSTNEELYGKSFNLDHYKSQLQYQGTSSMAYPIKNYRLNLRDEFGDKWYYDFPGGQGECRFTLKADFMSSGHWTNTGMAKFINDNLYNYKSDDEKSMNPFRWYRLQNGDDVSKYRETINGFPCRLILINDGSTPLNEGQNEPTPGNTKDMGIFNFNNDKDNVTTLGFNSDIFPNCASYEVTANSDTSAGAFMSYNNVDAEWMDGYYTAGGGVMSSEKSVGMYVVKVTEGDEYDIFRINGERFRLTLFREYPTEGMMGAARVDNSEVTEYTLIVPTGYSYMTIYVGESTTQDDVKIINKTAYAVSEELAYLKESFELRYPDEDDVAEDWGFMGVETTVKYLDYWITSNKMTTTTFSYSDTSIEVTGADVSYISCYGENGYINSALGSNGIYTMRDGTTKINITFTTSNIEKFYINGVMYMPGTTTSMNTIRESYDSIGFDTSYGLKALIDWVDNCTDEEFVADFEEHFHKDYTLRYFCLVTLIGAVDNLGKNMMLDTADNKIYFPRFYDIDTICSYDNSGQLKFDVDIEMEQGYWNTSSSRLWTRIRDLMHDDIVTTYNNMRQNGVSYENMMHYIYDEQIAKIPQTYYNKDYDIKYAPFADSYIGMAHGDTYEHVKRWLKQRFTFVDTLFDYAPSYNNDILTIRVNTTEEITLHLETYTPVYQHLSWYNGQMDKKKIDGKTSITFSGKVQAATDQEVLIYGGSNIKKITGIQSGNPNRLILGSATKLTELDASNCPLLSEINMNKANLSPHEYLNKVNLSNCPLLEGNLRLNNSPLIQELDIRGTNITGMNLSSSIRNLQVLRLPNTMTELTLNDASMLHTLEFDEGIALQSISMTNCNNLTNVVNFDLLQTPSITLDNSYNNVSELYFRDTTNLTVRNMKSLERVIYTPNDEYETFELINVANAPDYKITTFNCPKLSTFMTTAPYRESFNNCGMKDKEVEAFIDTILVENYKPQGATFEYNLPEYNSEDIYIFASIDISECTDIENGENILSIGRNLTDWFDDCTAHFYYIKSSNTLRIDLDNGVLCTINNVTNPINIELNKNGLFINDTHIPNNGGRYVENILKLTSLNIGSCEGTNRSNATYNYIKTSAKGMATIQIKDYGNIQPNTTFTANSIDISSTQFTDVKLLCTTDTNTLKLPTTIKNFYCDSSFDLDTDYLTDGEYNVIHGELIEQYTTDYEGEVNIFESIEINIVDNGELGAFDGTTLEEITSDTVYRTDFIRVIPGTVVKFITINNQNTVPFQAIGYDENKENPIKIFSLNGYVYTHDYTVPSTVHYIRYATANTTSYISTTMLRTPNLIPSSADGSLIFSMYTPSNVVAPASGTWDLKGLEFDNFHTYGMNNDVKPEYIYERYMLDSSKLYKIHNDSGDNAIWWYDGWLGEMKSNNSVRLLPLKISDKNLNVSISGNEGSKANLNLMVKSSSGSVNQTESSTYPVTRNNAIEILIAYFGDTSNLEYIDIDLSDGRKYRIYVKEITNIYSTNATLTEEEKTDIINNYTFNIDSVVDIPRSIRNIASLSMPSRYDDYNITIKNANISPKTHNTMLYPLLVNEDNPIEGKLDYTNYTGNNLSWSFAYVNMNKVNIVQPKDELLNTYEYRYNAFYETEYEFDDPNEVLRYITSSSNLLPTFNEGFTYTYDKLDNNDGTYIYRIYANDPTLLTSFELEKVPYLRITNAENLLSPIDLTKYETVSISESYYDITELYFREATNLTLTNMPYLERVIYLPNDEYEVFEIINVVNSKDYIITTSECPRLTTFMTTASHRESYNNEDAIAEVITEFTNTDNELFTNEYVFSKTYWEEDGTEIQGSVNLLHYEIPSIEDSVKAIHMVQGLDSTNRVTFFNDDKFISCEVITTACELDFKLHRNCNRIVFVCEREGIVSSVVESILTTTLVKEYGSVEPNIIFNANTLDISNTQFTDVKLLCTTDLNTLKLPVTVRNFYCDSSFDLDTDYLTDGEYDVVHGEFTEPYTTDCEGEVVRNVTSTELFTLKSGTYPWNDRTYHTDFIRVAPNTSYTSNMVATGFWCVTFLAEDKETVVYKYVSSKGTDITAGNGVTPNDAHYMVFSCLNNNNPLTLEYIKSYTPNLIPSSSDGSLIFSMYAPSKTVQPASNTWDLYGLEFDNFHTFGMNNDVIGDIGYIKVGNHSELVKQRGNIVNNSDAKFGDISVNDAERITIVGFELPTQESSPHVITTSNGKGYRLLTDEGNDGTQNNPGYFYTSGNSYTWGSNNTHKFILELNGLDIEWINIDGVYYYIDKVRDLGIINPAPNFTYVINLFDYATSFTKISEYSFKIDEIKSLSMPSRYNNYNVTIKNANISPKTHNTMLYPLLINEDNPIEGKLDYTNYNGEYLSWSFAYTNTNKVNIIQPKNELLNSYEYRYNAFYRTEYEFDNPNEVMEYTTTSSNLLPIFNEGFTYAYDKIDNDNGTYTYKIYANDISLLTSFELEKVPYLRIVNAENLVSPIDLTKYEVVEIDNSYSNITELYFRDSTNLTLSNMSNLERVIYLPNDEYEVFELINVVNAPDYKITTFNCPKLSTFMTTAPYRESYNNCGTTTMPATTGTLIYKDYSPNGINFSKVVPFDYYNDVIEAEIDLTNCDAQHTNENILSFATTEGTLSVWGQNSVVHIYYTPSSKTLKFSYRGNSYNIDKILTDTIVNIKMDKGTIYLNNEIVLEGSIIESVFSPITTIAIGSKEGSVRSTALYKLVGVNYGEIDREIKDYDNIQPNTTFTANSIDISNTQFTDVKLLCTTDTNTLKLPTTVKNFYCDSSFDLDTDYLEDGEYDVVHGEFVEPYTTDYEGEVYRCKVETVIKLITDLPHEVGYGYDFNGNYIQVSGYITTDYIEVTGNQIQIIKGGVYTCMAFDKNKSSIGLTPIASLPSSCVYVRLSSNKLDTVIQYEGANYYTPNLIPSSADGSLIFSMYAPNNAVAPASGVWDLKGLEFDNFHTFGMNNDVKPSEDSYIKVVNPSDIIAYTGKATNIDYPHGQIYWDTGQAKNIAFTCIRLSAGGHTITTSEEGYNVYTFAYSNIGDTTKTNHYGMAGFTFDSPKYISFQVPNTTEYIEIDGCRIYLDEITIIDGQLYKDSSGWYNYLECGGKEIIFDKVRVDEILIPTSISMPSRYDDYNITIKNANIAPKTHNTMLYPLLVNEDNPITGTLDYTNYAGKYLSWSFAYTDEEYVNIIQPKDELINSYKYKYNTYYDTEYEFDNPYEIARYTSSASGVLPNFNAEFTYTYDEKDNRDGTYTTKIYANSMDNLPTVIRFSGETTLLTVDKLNTSNVTDMSFMFQYCNNLTSLDVSEFDTSKVISMYSMFYDCKSLTSLDVSGFDTGNVTSMANMFLSCSKLTSLDVSEFDTGKVTTMGSMFNGCGNLTSLNLSGFDTSNLSDMGNMFYNCSSLTSLDLSSFDTSKVTNMYGVFYGCSGLTSLDISEFDTSKVTNMDSTFYNCSKLTSLDLSGFDTGEVTVMINMFQNCRGLTSLDLSGFDTGNVTSMAGMFRDCRGLTSLDLSEFETGEVTSMYEMFRDCNNLTSLDLSSFDTSDVTSMYRMFYNCSSLTSLDVSGFDTSKVIYMDGMFHGCSGLTSLDVTNWSLDKINTIIPQLSVSPSTSTLYGSVIIDESTLPSGWVYNNVLEVAIYTCSTSGVLPNFNAEFTYTHAEVDNGDGTYTTKVVADSIDNLPTNISFYTKSALLSVERMNVSKVTFSQGMFYQCSNVTHINSSNWDTSSMTSMNNMFNGCSKLTSLDVSGFDTKNVTNMFGMFSGCSKLTSLDVSGFDTGKVTTMGNMFRDCRGLTSIDVSGFDTSEVTTMGNMFYGCNNLTSLDLSGFDTGNVTNMACIVYNCSGLTSLDLSGFDTKNVKDMDSMFFGCRGLTSLDVSGFDTREVTKMLSMFNSCINLTSLDLSSFNTSNVTTMQSMFQGCTSLTSLDLSNFNTSNVTSMYAMFSGCNKLISLDLSSFNTSNVDNMTYMFYMCMELTSLDVSNFNTSKVAKMGCMFDTCSKLTSIDVSNFDTSKVTDMGAMFNNCRSLISLNVSNWSLDKVNTIIPQLSVSPSSSTLYGSVAIDESTLPNGWVYDNALEVAMYTCSTSGVLPTFNTEFTYTHSETSNEDGTYTTKVVTDSIDNLPTSISFYNIRELIEVHKLNTSEVTTMQTMFQHCKTLTTINSSSWDTSKVTNMKYMFNNCSALTTLDVSNWNTKNVVSMYGTFSGCTQLTTLDVSKWNTKNVDTMQLLFSDCPNITTLDVSNFDTSKVINMSSMFNGCLKLTTLDVSNFDTSNVTNMSMMFKNCNKLIALNVSNFDTSKVTNMGEMFSGCNVLSIEGLGNWDVKNVTDMGSMFLHCRGITSLLEISDWDTSSLKGLYRTFMGCTELIELDVSNWNASKFESLLETFYNCAKIISFNLGNWDCRRVVSISGMFHGCSSLSSIILPKEVRKGCNAVSALRNCTNLKEVALPKGIGNISHMLNNCYNLEKAVIPLDDITDVQDTTFNNCRALVDIDWVGDLSNNFNIISNTGEHVTTESDVHELMTNLGDLKKDKIKISLSKGTIKVNNTEKTIE